MSNHTLSAPAEKPALFRRALLATLLLSTVMLHGCASTRMDVNDSLGSHSCRLPSHKQLISAVAQSKKTLVVAACQREFNSHFDALVTISAGAPADSNLDILARFSQWGVAQGIISQKQSEATLRRYFSPQLVSLDYDADYSLYNHCSMQSRLADINRLLKQELQQKQQGLAGALGDYKTYQAAVKEYQSVSLLLKTTSAACHQASL
jgi:hypothetical protein